MVPWKIAARYFGAIIEKQWRFSYPRINFELRRIRAYNEVSYIINEAFSISIYRCFK